MTNTSPSPSSRPVLVGFIWAAQAIVAFFFLYGAYMKLWMPADALGQMMPWTKDHPTLVTVTGVVDLLGGIGILLPALLRILPRLSILAGIGIIVLQFIAIIFHSWRGEIAVLPMNFILVALTAFVLWGRIKAVPFTIK